MRRATSEDRRIGTKALLEGEVGAILLAAGEGTRLGFHKPKALFPILKNKTLIDLFFEKIVRATSRYSREIPVAVMCSKSNLPLIEEHVRSKHFYGLSEKSIELFSQTEKPIYLREENRLIETSSSSPDGNGALFESIKTTGILQRARYLTVTPIDNPLADPLDAKFIGFHIYEKNDASVIAISEKGPEEKMGAIIEGNGRIKIIEYTESAQSNFFNTALLLFSSSFMQKAAKLSLPYHLIEKVKEGKRIIKYERFIFDSFEEAEKIGALLYSRRDCYAPLKTVEGVCGIEETRDALR